MTSNDRLEENEHAIGSSTAMIDVVLNVLIWEVSHGAGSGLAGMGM